MAIWNPPDFNLDVKIWNLPSDLDGTGPPDVTTTGQLYYSKNLFADLTYNDSKLWYAITHIRLPKLTDVRWGPGTPPKSSIEIPAGSGCIYNVHQVVDFHKGFDNEYRVALSLLRLVPPFPIP